MAELCGLCNEGLMNRPSTELLCHHFFHTECLLRDVAHLVSIHHRQFHQIHCSLCDEQLLLPDNEVPADPVEQQPGTIDENAEVLRINTLYDTNEEFRNDIKKYIAATRGVSKPRAAFHKLCQAKKTELAPAYALMKAQYEGLYSTKKEDLVTSEEYKAFRRAEAKYTRHWSILREKYALRTGYIDVLRTKPGCKSIRYLFRWRSRPQWLIRKALRLRLPWW